MWQFLMVFYVIFFAAGFMGGAAQRARKFPAGFCRNPCRPRCAEEPRESPQPSSLLRAYGVLTIVFAPIGLIEYAVEAAQIPWLGTLSLDHFFYLAWNVVSMSVALRLFAAEHDVGKAFNRAGSAGGMASRC